MKLIIVVFTLLRASIVFAALPPASIPETCGRRQAGQDMTYFELPIYIDGKATIKYSETVIGINGFVYALSKCRDTILALKTSENRILVGECITYPVVGNPNMSMTAVSPTGYGLDEQVPLDGSGRLASSGSSRGSAYTLSRGSSILKKVIYGFHKDFAEPRLIWESQEVLNTDTNGSIGISGSCQLARESILAARPNHVDITKVSGYKSNDPYGRKDTRGK